MLSKRGGGGGGSGLICIQAYSLKLTRFTSEDDCESEIAGDIPLSFCLF